MADEIVYDVDGYDEVTKALLALINNYPALGANERIEFATLGEKSGKAMFPISGAMIQTETEDITGHVTQDCLYPFYHPYQGRNPVAFDHGRAHVSLPVARRQEARLHRGPHLPQGA